ncbi:Putative Zinc finger, CCHC-type [Colletotrichum destructivum]|uniref:Zinc finger, CCHC-type n=1 Tax=Colletotrichum destructivum TaxID=34406 RepID=A0AAX4IQS2_9PEZI|nr:Putative Zinc finger, CCHC-type [Colletotrichum destructivum]
MTDRAPGSGPATKEPSCINCGGTGHWAVACPEPVRAKPAGLSRRNTSTSHDHARGGDHQHGGRRPGAVVTKYPAPPTGNPIVTRYGPPPPGQPLAPPYPGPPQPYPSYPPPPNGYAPPPPGSYPGYPQYSTPPPPPAPPPGAYPPPSGPPASSGPYHYPVPSQYGGSPPGPPGPPPSYQPPPHYPSGGSYAPSYSPPSGYHPAPAPPSSSHYPPPYNSTSTSPGGYSSSTYGPPPVQPLYGAQPGPPPPPPSYAQPYGPPESGYGPLPSLPAPPRTIPPRLPPGLPSGLPPIPPHRNQLPRDRHGRHRQGQNNRPDRSRKTNKHGNPKRDASQPKPKMGGTKEKQVPARVESEPKVLKTTPVPSTTPESRHANTVSEEGVDDDEADWKWEEEMIFKETDKPHQPDPIAKPLPGPEGYHDNIMLPPAWNATCIQSEFVTEENLVEFSRPVRETERFASLQLDPAFWRSPVDSKIVKQQPEVRDKPITFKSVRLPGFPSLPPKPPTPENRDYRPMNSRKRTWEDSPYKSSLATGNQEGGEWGDHRHKRHRGDSHSGYDTASPHNRRTREDSRPIDRYRSQKLDRVDSDPAQMLLKSLEDPYDAGPSRRHDGEKLSIRQDSVYYSSRHARHHTLTNSTREGGRTSPPSGTSPPERNPRGRHASRSRSRSRRSPRRGSHSSQAESRPASRQSVASFVSHGTEDSELSALEAELLGIAPKSKEGTEGKLGDHATKLRKRVQKVDSAYGRRW